MAVVEELGGGPASGRTARGDGDISWRDLLVRHRGSSCLAWNTGARPIYKPPSSASTSAKRSLISEDEVVAKRRRAGDTTEILITQRAHAVAGPSAIAPSRPETSLTPVTSTPSRALTRTGGTPLLDLKNGELAIIRTGELGPPSRPSGSTTPSGPFGPARYELRRHDRIARTLSASVFTSQNSAIAENVVAKVIRYEGRVATDLARCAMA